MSNVGLILGGIAFGLSLIACIGAFTAIAIVVGLKNSTHRIEYKPVEVPTPTDPFIDEEEVLDQTFNPNKRQKLQVVKNDQEDFADLDDPTTTSNEWN